jgi:hypothetical protein
MKAIKLSGREAAVLRAIGFGMGIPGQELCERVQMAEEDLVDVLNTLLDAGYAETESMRERVTVADFAAETYEVNPSYAGDLKAAMRRD